MDEVNTAALKRAAQNFDTNELENIKNAGLIDIRKHSKTLYENAVQSYRIDECLEEEDRQSLCIKQADFLEKLVTLGVTLPPGSTLGHSLLWMSGMSSERRCVLLRLLIAAGLSQDFYTKIKDGLTLPEVAFKSSPQSFYTVMRCLVLDGMPLKVLEKSELLDLITYRNFIDKDFSQIMIKIIKCLPIKFEFEHWNYIGYFDCFSLRMIATLVQAGYDHAGIINSLLSKSFYEGSFNGYELVRWAKPYFLNHNICLLSYCVGKQGRKEANRTLFDKYYQHKKQPPPLGALASSVIRQTLIHKQKGRSAFPLFKKYCKAVRLPFDCEISDLITLERFQVLDTSPIKFNKWETPWEMYKRRHLVSEEDRDEFFDKCLDDDQSDWETASDSD